MNAQEKAYLAGVLDSDGSIMLQLRKRSDARLGYRVKTTICLYQRDKHRPVLEELNDVIGFGYVYSRSDGMAELRIEGHMRVKSFLTLLLPYLRFKKCQAELMLKTIDLLQNSDLTPEVLLEVSLLSEKISRANNAPRRRKNNYSSVRSDLLEMGLISP